LADGDELAGMVMPGAEGDGAGAVLGLPEVQDHIIVGGVVIVRRTDRANPMRALAIRDADGPERQSR
jgi:hypothetical protein